MTKIERRPNKIAFLGTFAVWIFLFVLFSFASLLPQKKVYKSVKISLSEATTPLRAEKKEAAPPAQELKPDKETATQESAQKIEEKSVQKAQQKPAVKKQETATAPVGKKTENVPEKKAVQTLQKSVEELIAEQRKSRPVQKKEFDWSKFENSSSETSNSSPSTASSNLQTTPVNKINEFEGTSAQAAASENSSSKSSNSSSQANKNVSSSTSAALKNIASSSYSSTAGNGVTSTSNIKTASSPDGKIALVMSDGTSRTLLEPEKPVINLSPAASATISATVELNISFTVNPDGRVLVNSIKIPSALTSALVRREIEEQISRWRFTADSDSATAFFTHRIVKR
ncbi:hypothetical protein [Treponema pectinovorum]|uniref:hypothetical protein n=1 Tax=Treponema pectinovorum TaxID=164 RepID=UPI0011F11F62|nr:hypothetical protein [Treponema pectinovorum]